MLLHPLEFAAVLSTASRLLQRVVRQASTSHGVSPHILRRTFGSAGLVRDVPLRNRHYARRHTDGHARGGARTGSPRPKD